MAHLLQFDPDTIVVDVNGARIHRARSSDTVIKVYKSTKLELHILTERSLSHMERSARHYRMAPGLLSSDPCVAGPLAQPKVFLWQRIFCYNSSYYYKAGVQLFCIILKGCTISNERVIISGRNVFSRLGHRA
jgi:hypothetical protein